MNADWFGIIKSIAPTIATAVLGPLGGVAVSAIGSVLGVDKPTQDKIADVISNGQLTPDQISALKMKELEFQQHEKDMGFSYAELAFKDRDSARQANVSGGIQKQLFVMSLTLLCLTLGTEVTVLFNGYPKDIPEIIVGRVLGLMDAVAMMVLAYYYGTSSGSAAKTDLLAQAEPIKGK